MKVGRDERVHLSEHDVIINDSTQAGGSTDPPHDDVDRIYWPQTKSDRLLQDVQGSEKRKTMWKKIKGQWMVRRISKPPNYLYWRVCSPILQLVIIKYNCLHLYLNDKIIIIIVFHR